MQFGIWIGDNEFSIAYSNNGITESIVSQHKTTTFPLYFSITPNYVLFSYEAKNHVTADESSTAYHIRQLIGRNYDDQLVREVEKEVTYKISCSETNSPIIELYTTRGDYFHIAESIMALVMEHMKYIIKKEKSEENPSVNFCVPLYFKKSQIESLKNCAKVAGFENIDVHYDFEMFACYFLSEKKIDTTLCILALEEDTFSWAVLGIQSRLITPISAEAIKVDNHPKKCVFEDLKKKISDKNHNRSLTSKQIILLKQKASEIISQLSTCNSINVDLSMFIPNYYIHYSQDDLMMVIDPCFNDLLVEIEKINEHYTIQSVSFLFDFNELKRLCDDLLPVFGDDTEIAELNNMKSSCAIGAAEYKTKKIGIIEKIYHEEEETEENKIVDTETIKYYKKKTDELINLTVNIERLIDKLNGFYRYILENVFYKDNLLYKGKEQSAEEKTKHFIPYTDKRIMENISFELKDEIAQKLTEFELVDVTEYIPIDFT